MSIDGSCRRTPQPPSRGRTPNTVDDAWIANVLGPLFLSFVEKEGGNAAVDRVFADFPTEKELLTPSLYAAGVDDIDVVVAAPGDSIEIAEPGPWPMFDALVMLDAWLPWRQARDPFDGWSGGGRVSYERTDGAICVTAAAVFDNETSTVQFAQAVSAWAVTSGSAAVPQTTGTRVSFQACQRGPAATNPSRPEVSPSTAAYLEHALITEAAPTTPEQRILAICIARTMIDDALLAPLWSKADVTPEEDAAMLRQAQIAMWSCSAG